MTRILGDFEDDRRRPNRPEAASGFRNRGGGDRGGKQNMGLEIGATH